MPLQEDPALIELLATLNLGDDIPEPLYRAVAEVIAFAYLLSGRFPEGFETPGEGGGPVNGPVDILRGIRRPF